MTLTAAQQNKFFTAGFQMGLTKNQTAVLAAEGLMTEADFIDFKAKDLKVTFKNMSYGVPGVPGIPAVAEKIDGAGIIVVVVIPAVSPVPGIQATPINAQISSRLLVASVDWTYYLEIDRKTMANNMHF